MDYSPAEFTAIFIQVVIVLIIVRRSVAMTRGVPYSVGRLVALPFLILVLWAFAELESLLLTPWAVPYLLALDTVILVGTSMAFAPVAERMTRVTRDSAGGGTVRIGFALAGLFALAFVVRISLAIVLFPSSLEFGAPVGGYPAVDQQIALAGIDALFSFSAGLVVARSVGIRRMWNASEPGTGTLV